MMSSLITNFEPPVFGDRSLTCSVGEFHLPTCGDDREPRQQLSSFYRRLALCYALVKRPQNAGALRAGMPALRFDNASRRRITSMRIDDERSRSFRGTLYQLPGIVFAILRIACLVSNLASHPLSALSIRTTTMTSRSSGLRTRRESTSGRNRVC